MKNNKKNKNKFGDNLYRLIPYLKPYKTEIIGAIIAKLMENRTVISIAHRLLTVINSDRIIFIKEGIVVETGCHQELIAANGLYGKIYKNEEQLNINE